MIFTHGRSTRRHLYYPWPRSICKEYCVTICIGTLPYYASYYTCPNITDAINTLPTYTVDPGIIHYQALLYFIGFIKGNSNEVLKFYQDVYNAQLYSVLRGNSIKVSRGLIKLFTDSSWNDCMDISQWSKHVQ